MDGQASLSLEELVRQFKIVPAPIAALDLESGMVLQIAGKLSVVISVGYENTEAGPKVVIETVDGLSSCANDLQVEVWHMNGEPFIVTARSESLGNHIPSGGSGPATPAHDAAGIVPVWRGPKRF